MQERRSKSSRVLLVQDVLNKLSTISTRLSVTHPHARKIVEVCITEARGECGPDDVSEHLLQDISQMASHMDWWWRRGTSDVFCLGSICAVILSSQSNG